MNNNTTCLFAASTLALTFNDIYLIIVGISILVSTIIAIINAIKSGKSVSIDKTTQDTLKDIDSQLNKDATNNNEDPTEE